MEENTFPLRMASVSSFSPGFCGLTTGRIILGIVKETAEKGHDKKTLVEITLGQPKGPKSDILSLPSVSNRSTLFVRADGRAHLGSLPRRDPIMPNA